MRPLRRFCRVRDDVDFCRDLRACDFAANDFRDLVLFVPLARRNRRPRPFRDLVRDFFTGCRLRAPFETEVARLTALRTVRSLLAAFPARAPTTPPTTAPTGQLGNIFDQLQDTSHARVDVGLTKLKCSRTLIGTRQLISSRNTVSV